MRSWPKMQLISVKIEMSATEARDLYAELYRLSADEIVKPYPAGSEIAKLMRELADNGADE